MNGTISVNRGFEMKKTGLELFLSPIFLSLILFFSPTVIFAGEIDSASFHPQIEGTIRAKYEYNTSLNASRFQVRNARFSVNGNFNSLVSYKTEIDLSDEGQTKMLDAYIRLQPQKWFTFTIGQQKIPFSTDNLRPPHLLYFANRSFIGKQLTALRDVGTTLSFVNNKTLPFEFITGLYNGEGLYNQKIWQTSFSYAFRLVLHPFENLHFSLNHNSIRPEEMRMNLYDLGGILQLKNWHLETELFYKTYQQNFFPTTKGFFVFSSYDIYLHNKESIKIIRPLIRYDSMTDNNKGYKSENGSYESDDMARSRITGGITLCLDKPFLNDIRLNYEQYFYKKGIQNNDNKFVVEFVLRF
ncbi:MAG TPA: porin [Paludibacteraceae bacterium]|nr:porin [Paludibacteraceae bacterium]